MAIITLITDYGWSDYYVGAMKGAILRIFPDVQLVDVTHEIAPYNIADAAFVLWRTVDSFPQGTVHLVVVDPGVGTPRAVVAGKCREQFVIGPDNGVFTLLKRGMGVECAFRVENSSYFGPRRSATFHGRDIMSPVAAHVAKGLKLKELGKRVASIEELPIEPRAQVAGRTIRGQVLYVDRFGTLVTNIHADQLGGAAGARWAFKVAEMALGPLRRTFADVSVGSPLVLVGSCGLVEIAVREGSAVERFGRGVAIDAALSAD